jgi:hypothetical protein
LFLFVWFSQTLPPGQRSAHCFSWANSINYLPRRRLLIQSGQATRSWLKDSLHTEKFTGICSWYVIEYRLPVNGSQICLNIYPICGRQASFHLED